MKKFWIFGALSAIVSLCAFTSVYTAAAETAALPLRVVAQQQQNVPENVVNYLNDKLIQVVTANGLGSADYNTRFVITASVTPVTKNIVPGPPRQFSEDLDITLYIADNISHNVFSSVTVSAKAVEASEEKVLVKAIRSVNVNSPKIVSFIKNGTDKIIDYYNSQCENIIAKAKVLAAQKQYEAALFELNAIPSCCTDAYKISSVEAGKIYAEFIDYQASTFLSKAKAIWAAEQNPDGAKIAGEYLSRILPESGSYSEAEKLYQEIKKEIKEDLDFKIKIHDDATSLEESRINAWKEVGIAYGKNQQPVDNDVTWLVK